MADPEEADNTRDDVVVDDEGEEEVNDEVGSIRFIISSFSPLSH